MKIEITDYNVDDPDQGYYVVGVDAEQRGETYYDEKYPYLTAWCLQTFGPEDFWGSDPVSGWKRMGNQYYFTKEEMRTIFLLICTEF